MSSYNYHQPQVTPKKDGDKQYQLSDNELREHLLRQLQLQQEHQANQKKQMSIDNLRSQYKEQDRIRNEQVIQQQNDAKKNEVLQKLVEDYRQLKEQSISIQKDHEQKIRELLNQMHQQETVIQNMQNENKTLHNYYQRAEILLQQQKNRIVELEELLKQQQSPSTKDQQQPQSQNQNISPFKAQHESETRSYINSLSDDELIELVKLKRKADFEKHLQSREKLEQPQNNEALPQINQSQTHPISFARIPIKHQRSSSTFKKGIEVQSDQLIKQQQVIHNQQTIIDKLLNHSLQNQSTVQQLSHRQQQQKHDQIDFINNGSQIRMNSSRLRNRSPMKSSRDQHIDFLQKSVETKDRLIQELHNSKIKKDKDEALIDFFNKQSSYLIESSYYDKKNSDKKKS